MQKCLFVCLPLILFLADSQSVSTAYQWYSLHLLKRKIPKPLWRKPSIKKKKPNPKKEYLNYQPISKQLLVMAKVSHIWLLVIYGVSDRYASSLNALELMPTIVIIGFKRVCDSFRFSCQWGSLEQIVSVGILHVVSQATLNTPIMISIVLQLSSIINSVLWLRSTFSSS